MVALKPVSSEYLRDIKTFKPGDRLHRLVARLCDTYIDDLTDDQILKIEHFIDDFRLTHADGSRLEVGPF